MIDWRVLRRELEAGGSGSKLDDCGCADCEKIIQAAVNNEWACPFCGYSGPPTTYQCTCNDGECNPGGAFPKCPHGVVLCPLCDDGERLEALTRVLMKAAQRPSTAPSGLGACADCKQPLDPCGSAEREDGSLVCFDCLPLELEGYEKAEVAPTAQIKTLDDLEKLHRGLAKKAGPEYGAYHQGRADAYHTAAELAGKEPKIKTRQPAPPEPAKPCNCDQLRTQLGGCLIAAEGSDPNPPVERGAYGWSPAYQAVVDLRRERDAKPTPPPAVRAELKACGTCYFWDADSDGNGGTCMLLRDSDGAHRQTHYTDACGRWADQGRMRPDDPPTAAAVCASADVREAVDQLQQLWSADRERYEQLAFNLQVHSDEWQPTLGRLAKAMFTAQLRSESEVRREAFEKAELWCRKYADECGGGASLHADAALDLAQEMHVQAGGSGTGEDVKTNAEVRSQALNDAADLVLRIGEGNHPAGLADAIRALAMEIK